MKAITTFKDTVRMVEFLNLHNGRFVKCRGVKPDILQIEAKGLHIGMKLPTGFQIFHVGDSFVLTNEEADVKEKERRTFYVEFV